MIFRQSLLRLLHTSSINFNAEKSLLASLRKKTGYTFSNCKKALEMHNNDLRQAEEWLNQQAQKMGWTKAGKLEGRQTTQGLIGVAVKDNNGVMVEVNCETDFVARNEEFQKMVEEATKACMGYAEQQRDQNTITKICLDTEQLKNLTSTDGKSLADKMALMIGTVGENAILKRALCLKVGNGIHLTCYAHPSGNQRNEVSFGRLGGILAYKPLDESKEISEVSKGICQHIVGLDPKKIGTTNDKPAKNKEEEICLIHQEYLLDESVTIKELMEENKFEIIDFKRFQCGETLNTVGDQPLEYVETCQ